MHESDLHAEETAARDVVDHMHTLPRQVGKTTWQVVDRATNCNPAVVPPDIYSPGCTTN